MNENEHAPNVGLWVAVIALSCAMLFVIVTARNNTVPVTGLIRQVNEMEFRQTQLAEACRVRELLVDKKIAELERKVSALERGRGKVGDVGAKP